MTAKQNYVTIQGWMFDLGLTGNDIIVYAAIYGFCQDEQSDFHGGYEWLSKTLRIGRATAIRVVARLESDGLVERVVNESGKLVRWKANTRKKQAPSDPYQNDTRIKMIPVSKRYSNPSQNDTQTRIKMRPNNTNEKTKENKNTSSLTGVCNKNARVKEAEDVVISGLFDEFGNELTVSVNERYPYVCGMDVPLTQKQLDGVIKEYGVDVVVRILDEMENFKALHKNSRSANLTLRNWIRRKQDKEGAQPTGSQHTYRTKIDQARAEREAWQANAVSGAASIMMGGKKEELPF